MKLRSADVTWREIDGQSIILDLAASTYLTTNHTGSVLLRALTKECTEDDLADALVATFGISREQAATDVDAFVTSLRERSLLEAVGSGAA